jgi:hypothetical protein
MTDIGDGQAPAGAENAGWRHAEKVGLTDAEIVRLDRSATRINCANHVKRLAASVLERAGIIAARIEKTA